MEQWVDRYERAWRTAGTDGLGDLFSPDASYLPSPWAPPVEGLATIAGFWEDEREGPDEPFTMAHEVLAVDGTTAVVRVSVDYDRHGHARTALAGPLGHPLRRRRPLRRLRGVAVRAGATGRPRAPGLTAPGRHHLPVVDANLRVASTPNTRAMPMAQAHASHRSEPGSRPL